MLTRETFGLLSISIFDVLEYFLMLVSDLSKVPVVVFIPFDRLKVHQICKSHGLIHDAGLSVRYIGISGCPP